MVRTCNRKAVTWILYGILLSICLWHGSIESRAAAGKVFTVGNLVYKVLDEEAGTVQVGKGDAGPGSLGQYGARATGLAKSGVKVVNIPATVVDSDTQIEYKVTKVSSYAFYQCTDIQVLVIGENVTEIATGAFKGCTGIYSILWNARDVADFSYSSEAGNASVFTNVGDKSSTGMLVLTFGKQVTHVPARAFYTSSSDKCSSLTSITFDKSSQLDIGIYAFTGSAKLTSVTLPDTLTEIPAHCFEKCSSLSQLTISDKLTSIGDKAFSGCSGLTKLTLGKGLSSFGKEAFSGCTSLEELDWNAEQAADFEQGSGVFTSVGQNAEDGVTVTFGGDVKTIPANLFWTKTITNASQTANVTTIRFSNVETGEIAIGANAFRECRNLSTIELGQNITSIGQGAFYGCSKVQELTWNAKAVEDFTSGNGVFENLGSSTEGVTLTIGASVQKIPDYAFASNATSAGTTVKLTAVDIQTNGELEIGSYAFWNCTALKTLDEGAAVLSIGDHAFTGCKGITDLTFSGTGLMLGSYAFSGCTGLNSVTLGSGESTVGTYAFADCTNLKTVDIGEGISAIGEGAFNGIGNAASVAATIYNASKAAVSKGQQYNRDYVTVYSSWKTESEHGSTSFVENETDPVRKIYKDKDYVKAGTTALMNITPDYSVGNAWMISAVKLNGEAVAETSVSKQYQVTFQSCANDLVITYEERTTPFAAAIGDVGYDTLKEALDAAKAQENVEEILICDDMVLTSPVTIDQSITFIKDPNAEKDQVKIKNGVVNDSMIKVSKEGELTLQGAIILQGNSVLDIKSNKPMVTVEGTLTIGEGAIVEKQSGKGRMGGAIYDLGNVVVDGGVIRDNEAYYGAGVYVDTTGSLLVSGGQITGNTASYAGAGIYSAGNVSLGSDKVLITKNILSGGQTPSNLYLKKTGLSVAGDPSAETKIGLTYATLASASAGYLTDQAVDLQWASVLDSDSDKYAVGVSKAGRLYTGLRISYDTGIEEGDGLTGVVTGAALPDGTLEIPDELANLERDSYVLVGWFSGSKQYTDEMVLTSPITLTALWKEQIAKNGSTMYDSLGKAVTDAKDGDTLTLLNDTVLDEALEIGKNLTIVSDGHSISRKNGNNIFIITSANLSLDGVILDGNGKDGSLIYASDADVSLGEGTMLKNAKVSSSSKGQGTVYVGSGAQLSLDGASITGNTAQNGGGVYVEEGSFIMNSGTISGNSVNNSGGGVYAKSGTVRLNGGTITGNKYTSGNGGGIFLASDATLSVSGSPVVTGNTQTSRASNIYLASDDQTIQVAGNLTEEAKLGISLPANTQIPKAEKNADKIYEHTDRSIAGGTAAMPFGCFTADDSKYVAVPVSGGYVLRTNAFSVIFDVNAEDGKIKMDANTLSAEKVVKDIKYGESLEALFDLMDQAQITKPVVDEFDTTVVGYWIGEDNQRVSADYDQVTENLYLYAKWVGGICKAPVFKPDGGKYYDKVKLTLTTDTEEAEIYYTLDGTRPGANSKLYDGQPIELDDDVKIRAITLKDDNKDSEITEQEYTLRLVDSIAISGKAEAYRGFNTTLAADVTVGNSHTKKDVTWSLTDKASKDSWEQFTQSVVSQNSVSENDIPALEKVDLKAKGVTLSGNGILDVALDSEETSVYVLVESTENPFKKDIKQFTLRDPLYVTYQLGGTEEGDTPDEAIKAPEDDTMYKEDEAATLRTPPVWEGYTFDGWKIGNTEEIKQPGETVTMKSDVVFTGTWTKNEIKSIHIFKGENEVNQISEARGSKVTLTSQVEKAGNITDAVTWSIKETGAASTIDQEKGILNVARNESNALLTVVAASVYDPSKTAEVKVTVTPYIAEVKYYADETKLDELNSLFGEENTTITLPECPITKAGYTFGGWKFDSEDGITFKAGEQYKVTDDCAFYALWIENKVTKVTVSGPAQLKAGTNGTYEVKVEGTGTFDQEVNYSISGQKSAGTTISGNGLSCELVVAGDETAKELTLTAESKTFPAVKDAYTITVLSEVTALKKLSGEDGVTVGRSAAFEVGVVGVGDYSKEVSWSLTGDKTSEETKIQVDPENGLICNLSVGTDEKAQTLTLTAVSTANENATAVYTIPILGEVTKIEPVKGEEILSVGTSGTYEVGVQGDGNYSNAVTWKLSDEKTSEETKLEVDESNGLICKLLIGSDEQARSLTLTAFSVTNEEIKYDFAVQIDGKMTKIEAKSGPDKLAVGASGTYEVSVDGIGEYAKEIEWTVEGKKGDETGIAVSKDTTVSQNGLSCELTVGADEEAEELVLTAASKQDAQVKDSFTVKVLGNVTGIAQKSGAKEQTLGTSAAYEVTVQGTGTYAKDVTWTLTDNKSESTKITPDGTSCQLTIGEDEAAQTLTLTAVSDANDQASTSFTIKVIGKVTAVTKKSGEAELQAGTSGNYEVTVEGLGTYSAIIKWTLSADKTSAGTKFVPGERSCTLTIGADEKAQSLTLTAASEADNTKQAVFVITIRSASGQNPDGTGTGSGDSSGTGGQQTGGTTGTGGTGTGSGTGAGDSTSTGAGTGTGTATGSGQSADQTGQSGSGDTQTTVKAGTTFTVKGLKYKVTSTSKKTVEFIGAASKTKTIITIPKTVSYQKKSYKVTSLGKNCLKNYKKLKKVTVGANVQKIGAGAFYGDSSCKNIVIKSSKITSVGKNALKGIYKKAKITVPKKSLKKYKVLFKKKGQKSTVKFTS